MPFLEDIDRFSNDFKNIVIIIKNIEMKKNQIIENLKNVKNQYGDMVKSNTKKIFIFCLDSFFYQYKINSAELDQIESSRKMVNNRMYCEYYKLFGIVSTYLNNYNLNYENKQEFLKSCPIYKDLEPTFEYNIEEIENIYSNVVLLITYLYEQTIKNIAEIEGYGQTNQSGFSISNFVNTLRNENLILQGQNDLFINYLSFFLASQQKQHSRIDERITNFMNVLDIKIDNGEPIVLKESIINGEPIVLKESIDNGEPSVVIEGFAKESLRDSRLGSFGTPTKPLGGAKPRSSLDVVPADDRRSVDVSIRCEAASRNIDPFLESATIVADSERMKSTDDEQNNTSLSLDMAFE